jgi:type II secretory pathway predicted ATPase ExeA
MYTKYYNLSDKPFENTPDPFFLFLSKQHREVLSSLLYGIESAKGFILVSGDVGTGKTTLIRSLLKELNPGHIVINIINPRTTFDDIFNHLVQMLEVTVEGKNRLESIDMLRSKLETLNKEGRRAVIIIDEAHLLSKESLEEIRLLSNIENDKTKLIQIVMVGQNEIHNLLDRETQKPLKQRIVINRQLNPLDKKETIEYILHRLKVVGRSHQLFNDDALSLIWKVSGGTPRVINQICDNALLIGYALETGIIERKIIKEVISDMRPDFQKYRNYLSFFYKRRRAWAFAGIALLLLVTMRISGFTISEDLHTVTNRSLDNRSSSKSKPITANLSGPSSLDEPSSPDEIGGQVSPARSVGQSNQENPKKKVIQISPDSVKIARKDFSFSSKTILFRPNDIASSELPGKVRTIQPNEWLLSVALAEYGSTSETIIDLIQMANNNIKNIDQIYYGQKIVLPRITKDSMIVTGEGNTYHIHYASFYNFTTAQRATQRLLANGEDAFLIPSRQGQNLVFRVYIGIFSDRNEAKKLLKNLDFRFLSFLN